MKAQQLLLIVFAALALALAGCATAESTANLIRLAALAAGSEDGVPSSTQKTRLVRADPKFGAEMELLKSYVGTEPVNVVIAGVPPSGDGAIRAYSDSSQSDDVEERQTTYRQVVITKLDREVLEIRPTATSSSKLEIPNFQVEKITYTNVRQEVKSTWWYWIPFGFLIALSLMLAALILPRVISGPSLEGSGMPPVGCWTVLGILGLVGAVVVFLYANSEVGTGQKIIEEFVNRVWVFQ